MDSASRYLMERFTRTILSEFTAKEMQQALSSSGVKASISEIESFLQSNRNVFPLQNKKYISRSGIYTNEVFTIKPTRAEVEQGVFVVGSRCVPFVDPEMVSCALDFYAEGNLLKKKVATFDSDLAIDMFIFFGEEYATQFIANDPAVADLHLEERNFELPATVPLTGVDISYLKLHYGFEYGDRLLCAVKDWDEGVISLMVLKEAGNEFNLGSVGKMRLEWYDTLEKMLLESFDQYGPGVSIEDQINFAYSRHISELCLSTAGSLEEYYLDHMKKVSVEFFGVETRLWHKGESVPIVGKWSPMSINTIASRSLDDIITKTYDIPVEVIDQYCQDSCFRREKSEKEKPISKVILKRMYPDEYDWNDRHKAAVELKINERFDIVSKGYNWFRDQSAGPVRKQILALFSRVSYLVFRVDCSGHGLLAFPQKELVIMSQIYAHLIRMVYGLQSGEYGEDECNMLLDSVEGMSWNFDDVRKPIERVLAKQEKERFKVIKA